MFEEPWISLLFIALGGVALLAVALAHDWHIARAEKRRERDAAAHSAE